MMLSDCGGQNIEDAGGPVMPSCSHPNLDITCAFGDGFADGQHYVQRHTTFGDSPHIAEIPTGIAGLEINGHASSSGSVGN